MAIRKSSSWSSQDRSLALKAFQSREHKLLEEIRKERTYRLPKGYLSWETIVSNVGVAFTIPTLSTIESNDKRILLHCHRLSLWFANNAPLYCLASDILQALLHTDVINGNFFKDWEPALPSLFVALPKDTFFTTEGFDIEFLLIHINHPQHQEWNIGRWKNFDLIPPRVTSANMQIQIFCQDSNGNAWSMGVDIAEDGRTSCQVGEQDATDPCPPKDRVFIDNFCNLALNILLLLDYKPELISEVEDSDLPLPTKPRGFTPKIVGEKVLYPRWLGKETPGKAFKKTKSEPLGGTHASPRQHIRRGHWRSLEEGEHWKRSQMIWVRPTYVNFD